VNDPKPTRPPGQSPCEDDLARAAQRIESCGDRVEHLEALVDFYQSDNEHLRSILRMKDSLRNPNASNQSQPKPK